jgi:hypothetical protein
VRFEAKAFWMEFEEGSSTIRLGGNTVTCAYAEHDQWHSALASAGFPWVTAMVLDVRALEVVGSLSHGVFYWMASQIDRVPGVTLQVRGRSASQWQERILPVLPRICRRVAIELR